MKMIPSFTLHRVGLATCAFLSVAVATQVRAVSLTAANVIGYVLQATPAEPVDETARLQFFIDLNNTGSAIAPDANAYFPIFGANVPATLPTPATFGTKVTTSSLPLTIAAPYTYLMAKFGPDAVYYYVGGLTGSLDALFIPAGLGGNGNGLSHVSFFNQTGPTVPGPVPAVPDSGATIGLLAVAMSGVALFRRRFAR
jgi:hypothetical protein